MMWMSVGVFRLTGLPVRIVVYLLWLIMLAGCEGVPRVKNEETNAILKPNEYEVFGEVYQLLPSSLGYLEIGVASWYGTKFHGRLTANGEVYDMYGHSAAHKSLPLPTMVKVTNLDNGMHITLRVNDRGPFVDDRLIDLSYSAARMLGFEHQGTAPVVVEAIDEVNHPGQVATVHRAELYYLQIGAFKLEAGAIKKLADVKQLLPNHIEVTMLQSEEEQGALYKVWVGPLTDVAEQDTIAALIRGNDLGNPIRVNVE